MSAPSKWPLPADGVRVMTPGFMLSTLSRHPLTRGCYPAAMGYYPAARDHRMRRDRHDDNLLIYCVGGHGLARAGDWRGEVGAGEVLLLPRGTPHTYEAAAGDPWSIYWVHFRGDEAQAFNDYLGYREGEPPLWRAGLAPPLAARFDDLMTAQRTGYSARAFIHAANQLRQLLTYTALEIRHAEASGQQSFDLATVQRFMREHIGQPLDLDTLAAVANLSRYHFSAKYKALTGYSPIRHFLNMKMEHACQLLDASALSVTAVAAALGYDDPLYFSRQFRKTVGLSPRAYRASVRS